MLKNLIKSYVKKEKELTPAVQPISIFVLPKDKKSLKKLEDNIVKAFGEKTIDFRVLGFNTKNMTKLDIYQSVLENLRALILFYLM